MKEWIKKHQVTEVECIVPDLSGAARGKIMPAPKYTGGYPVGTRIVTSKSLHRRIQ